MSEISEKIQSYRGGKIAWSAVRDWLVAHRYVTPKRYDDPQPSPLEERDWDHPYVDGSWDEVQRAHAQGLLDDHEYREVSRGVDARAKARATA